MTEAVAGSRNASNWRNARRRRDGSPVSMCSSSRWASTLISAGASCAAPSMDTHALRRPRTTTETCRARIVGTIIAQIQQNGSPRVSDLRRQSAGAAVYAEEPGRVMHLRVMMDRPSRMAVRHMLHDPLAGVGEFLRGGLAQGISLPR